jgi:hypothetical protein
MEPAVVRVTEVVDLDGVRQVRAARAGDRTRSSSSPGWYSSAPTGLLR